MGAPRQRVAPHQNSAVVCARPDMATRACRQHPASINSSALLPPLLPLSWLHSSALVLHTITSTCTAPPHHPPAISPPWSAADTLTQYARNLKQLAPALNVEGDLLGAERHADTAQHIGQLLVTVQDEARRTRQQLDEGLLGLLGLLRPLAETIENQREEQRQQRELLQQQLELQRQQRQQLAEMLAGQVELKAMLSQFVPQTEQHPAAAAAHPQQQQLETAASAPSAPSSAAPPAAPQPQFSSPAARRHQMLVVDDEPASPSQQHMPAAGQLEQLLPAGEPAVAPSPWSPDVFADLESPAESSRQLQSLNPSSSSPAANPYFLGITPLPSPVCARRP